MFKKLRNYPIASSEILAPIILEDRIRCAIQHRWVDNKIRGGTTIFKDLFGTSGEIASLGTLIRVAYATGLYGPETYFDLIQIEKIRNAFAHKLEVKTFKDQPITEHIRLIKIRDRCPETKAIPVTIGSHLVVMPEPPEIPDLATNRGKFLDAVSLLSNLLYHEAHVRRPDPRIPAF